nr:ribonuclease H-like domain-containing protein [Tanacetum cinerariifolium]
MTLTLMAKAFTLNNTTSTNNIQRSSSNPSNMQIAQPVVQNAVQNPSIQIVENMNGLSVVSEIANQYGNRNVVTTPAEGNGNGINENNLQQALTSGTQSDKAPVYDSDGSTEVHLSKNCYDNDMFNMFTQEDQYTELLEPIPEPHQVPQNDSNVISEVSSVEQGGGTVEQHSINVEEHEISNLNKQLSKEKSTVSSLQEEKKTLKSDFKIREDELLDKQIQLENKIKELDNILVKTGQSIQTMYMLSLKPDSFYYTEQNMALAKFVRDFKSLAKEANKSLAKHKALELEIKHLLRAVVSQDIMSIVQNPFVVDSSNLQTKLEPYNDMQQMIERLQAQLGDQKGNSKDTPYVSNTLDPLSRKLENENVELEFQVLNYAKENAHLKTTYKNLFDSISMTRTQTKTIIDSLQNKLHVTIYENAKLRAQLFDKVAEQKDTTHGTSTNTKFAKQSILGKPPSSSRPKLYAVTHHPKSKTIPKIDESHALSKPVTLNYVPTPTESKVMKNDNVIFPGIFRNNSFEALRVDNFVPNKHVKASIKTKPITVSQPHVITKNEVNSKTNGFSPKDVKSTTRTRRLQPSNNHKNDKVPSKSKSC